MARLHDLWSRVEELPDLEKVRYAYLWANPFTEEAPGSRTIQMAVVPPPKPQLRSRSTKARRVLKSEPVKKKKQAQISRGPHVKYPVGRSYTGVVLRVSR